MRTERLLVLVLAAALAASLAGCATTSAGKTDELVWPFPPEKPRVRYVRAFTGPEDFKSSAWRDALRIIVPANPAASIAQPTGLALSPDDRILYVACAPRSRVVAFDRQTGEVREAANVEGQRPAQPFAVALDQAGNLYVSDSAAASVWVYTPDGKFKAQLGQGKLERPTGIAIDRRRQLLYVVEGGSNASQRHDVKVLSLAGEVLRTIGTRGTAPGDFNYPVHVAVDASGNVFVGDMLNFRVQVFDPDGRLVGVFGQAGLGGPGLFQKLKGLAFDAFGNLHAVDSEAGLVQMFNAKQQPLMAYGGRADRTGFMLVPTAIAIDSKNTIFVADYASNRISEYQLFNTTAEESFAPDVGAAPQRATP